MVEHAHPRRRGLFGSLALSGGLSPLIMASLFNSSGGTTGISIHLIALAVVTLIATLSVSETAHKPLR
jgi:anaerobic C4-dicarboxylate transporter